MFALDPVILPTCFICPCRTVLHGGGFPRQKIMGFFLGCLAFLRDVTFGKQNSLKVRQGHKKRMQNFRVSHKLRRHLDFSAGNVQKLRLRIVITWFQRTLGFGRQVWLNIGSYAVRSWNTFAILCTNMPWSTWKRLVSEKKMRIFIFCLYGNAWLQKLTSWRACSFSALT